jgi:signal transduction histidine kinase/CheY-like chemotaxis protein
MLLQPDAGYFDFIQPFHIAFDRQGTLLQLGPSLQKLAPGLTVGSPVQGHLLFVGDTGLVSLNDVCRPQPYPVTVRVIPGNFALTGQVFPTAVSDAFVFLGTLLLANIDDARKAGIMLADLPPYFPYLEMLTLLDTRTAALADARMLAASLDARRIELQSANAAMARTMATLRSTEAKLRAQQAATQAFQATLEKSSAELLEANRKLEESSRQKDEFLAFLSHELRTPLAGILSVAELLCAQIVGPLNPRQMTYLQKVHERGVYIKSLIDDLLDFAKLDKGKITLEISTFGAGDLAREAFHIVSEAAQRRKHEALLEVPEEPVAIRGEPRRLKQVLVNLLDNAIKYTPEGGKIGLRVTRVDNEIEFCVWDTGVGIPVEHQSRIFEAFHRIENPKASNPSGVGLGLALVQRIVGLHGGKVELTSEAGRGSQFRFRLPMVLPASADAPALRVLLAGLDVDWVDPLTTRFRHEGWSVASATTIEELLAAPESFHPDLIVVGLEFSGTSGCIAVKKLRESGVEVPILGVSMKASNEIRQQCIDAGMDDVFGKPFRVDDLMSAVSSLMAHSFQF